jgi:TrmH family RNA methyltransferase
VIDSPKNPKIVSLLRAVAEKKLFVIEGEKLVADAAASGFAFETIFHDESLKPGKLAALSKHRPALASTEVLKRFSDARAPQHVVALAKPKESTTEEILQARGPAVYLSAVQDPGNVGAIARVVEAIGGAGMLASEGCASFFHPRSIRGSAGSLLRLRVASDVDFGMAAELARSFGREVCGTSGRGGENVFEAKLKKSSLWVFGSEGSGLPEAIAARLDRRITIPMEPPVESLNVAVAAGIVLYNVPAR